MSATTFTGSESRYDCVKYGAHDLVAERGSYQPSLYSDRDTCQNTLQTPKNLDQDARYMVAWFATFAVHRAGTTDE